MAQPPGMPPPTDSRSSPRARAPEPAAVNNPESSLASSQGNIVASPPSVPPPSVPPTTVSPSQSAAAASLRQAPSTPPRSREFNVVLSPRRPQQQPPSLSSPPTAGAQPSPAARALPPPPPPPPALPPSRQPLPPLPHAEGSSRSRVHAREMLDRLYPSAVVFASRCRRCITKSEVCWGSSTGQISRKCGPCIYAGRTCELTRDQVSLPFSSSRTPNVLC